MDVHVVVCFSRPASCHASSVWLTVVARGEAGRTGGPGFCLLLFGVQGTWAKRERAQNGLGMVSVPWLRALFIMICLLFLFGCKDWKRGQRAETTARPNRNTARPMPLCSL